MAVTPQPPLPAGEIEGVVASLRGLWEEFRGRRLLVTGATGFFGRWLLESALAADRELGLGLRISALSRDPGRFCALAPHLGPQPGLAWIRGSVTEMTPASWSGGGLDCVVHLATEADLGSTTADPTAAVDVVAGGTRRMLEVARAAGAGRFLLTSSGIAYGAQPAAVERLPETPAGRAGGAEPASRAYAIGAEAKRQAERACAEQAAEGGLVPVIARCFTFAGPAQPLDGKFAFGNFLRDALAGRPVVVTGDGSPVRSYLYASDLAVWLWTLLARGDAAEPCNVGSEEAVSLRELAGAVARELGTPAPEVRQAPDPARPPSRYVPSTRRVRERYGLGQSVGLAEAIRRTADWHRRAGRY